MQDCGVPSVCPNRRLLDLYSCLFAPPMQLPVVERWIDAAGLEQNLVP